MLKIGKQGDFEVYPENTMDFTENLDFEIQLMNSGKAVRTKEEYYDAYEEGLNAAFAYVIQMLKSSRV